MVSVCNCIQTHQFFLCRLNSKRESFKRHSLVNKCFLLFFGTSLHFLLRLVVLQLPITKSSNQYCIKTRARYDWTRRRSSRSSNRKGQGKRNTENRDDTMHSMILLLLLPPLSSSSSSSSMRMHYIQLFFITFGTSVRLLTANNERIQFKTTMLWPVAHNKAAKWKAIIPRKPRMR